LGFVVITHPFHPLSGQRLEVLVCSGGVGGQMTVPLSWTDRGDPPGPHRLSIEGLIELSEVTRAIGGC
jgi:hypothetical protein